MADDKLSLDQKKKLFEKLSQEAYRQSLDENFPQDRLKQIVAKKKEIAEALGREAREQQNKPMVLNKAVDKIKNNEVVDRISNVTEKINPNEKIKTIKGVTQHLPDEKMTLKTGEEFAEKIAQKIAKHRALSKAGKMASKFAKTGLKSLPLIGGLVAAASSGDVSAAVPILGDIESLGPKEGSEEAMIEDMSLPMEKRIELLKSMKKGKK